MSDLDAFRDHCAAMTTAVHRPECFTRETPWSKPKPLKGCKGCVTDADRALFKQLAAEVEAYQAAPSDAPQEALFS